MQEIKILTHSDKINKQSVEKILYVYMSGNHSSKITYKKIEIFAFSASQLSYKMSFLNIIYISYIWTDHFPNLFQTLPTSFANKTDGFQKSVICT